LYIRFTTVKPAVANAMTYPDSNLPWIDSPFFEKKLREATLTDDEKAFVKSYSDNGYIIFDPQIPESLLDEAVHEMMPWFAKIKGDDKRIQDAWKYCPAVQQIAAHSSVTRAVQMLYQRNPIPFQTLSFCEGTQQDTHSDLIHFGSIPQRFMCGVWVAMEDITDFNGPLHYYPGSHKLPFYEMIDMGVKASSLRMKKTMMLYAKNYTEFIQKMVDALGLEKRTLNIKKGQAIIWSANLLHGGNTILHAGSSRFSQVTHYYFEDCMYYVPRLSDIAINKIYFPDLANIATGERIKSKYFGKEVRPSNGLFLEQKARRMLNSIASLFPGEVVDKIRSVVRK
jgi:ectoine hydroxylase-related dioxygenase (phytanoyl-CoA dioxygenase family)